MILNDFTLSIIVLILLWAGLSGSWNILCGYMGQLSLGHVAFMGIGAYTSSILFLDYKISPWIGMLVGGLLSVLIAYVIGYATIRLKGPFFSMATIGISEVLRNIALLWRDVTKGSVGVTIPYQPGLGNLVFESKWGYILVISVYLILVIYITHRMENSRFGYYLRSISQDEHAAECLGVDTMKMNLRALAISAFLTSLGGTLYAQYIMFIDPESMFTFSLSIQMVIIAVVGGMGTVWGPLLGSILITPLSTFLQDFLRNFGSGLYLVIYGLILIIVVLYLPKGIAGLIQSQMRKKRRIKANGKKRSVGANG
jgi:branched-chain amino acid transport system permease protein